MARICIKEAYFYILISLFCLMVFSNYEILREKGKTEKKENFTISQTQTDCIKQSIETCLNKAIQGPQVSSTNQQFLTKITNPLAPPENVYSGYYDAYTQYQQLGYLTNATGQYPVFGRRRYPNRSDKMEYYTINNNNRNDIKIPFKNKNYNELMDGDSIDIPEIGGVSTYKQYDIQGFRYNPNPFAY